ncbi:MAG: xanthine dehydrogenase small subunit [Halieaceae bacterium]|jgi:xanthine dehydrogenase small subunit
MIRFLHRDAEVALEDTAADTTVLEYLRDQCHLTGTKEGCASGDCGACTVVTASACDAGLRYEPLNSCIAALGSLHGKQLISVEDLPEEQAWHPVQQAMIDCHGSQCGFCTPGFIMSMFALYQTQSKEQHELPRETILEALGGNLCRCTGYRPIVEAAVRALPQAKEADKFSRSEQSTRDRLRAIAAREDHGPALMHAEQRYFRPFDAAAVSTLLEEHPEARLIAGGTDLFLELTQNLQALPQLIDLRAAAELDQVTLSEQAISLGAAVSHRACLPAVLSDYPELAELIERFGSLQIRSQGTVVGNVANASPIGDWPPVLLALDATITLQSRDGTRHLPLADFFLDYRKTALGKGEFIRSVEIPRREPGLFLRAYKISKRYEDDISSVCAVFALSMQGDMVRRARIAFGGMAAIPKRAASCERALQGRALNAESMQAAASVLGDDFQPISDARASAEYRMTVAGNLFQRLLLEHSSDVPTRAHDSHGPAGPDHMDAGANDHV